MPLHPKAPLSLASFKSRLVLPFWYRLTQVVLEKTPLSGCSSSSSSSAGGGGSSSRDRGYAISVICHTLLFHVGHDLVHSGSAVVQNQYQDQFDICSIPCYHKSPHLQWTAFLMVTIVTLSKIETWLLQISHRKLYMLCHLAWLLVTVSYI